MYGFSKSVSFTVETKDGKQIIKTSLGMTYELGIELAEDAIEFLCYKTVVQQIHKILDFYGSFKGEFIFIFKPL